MLMSRRFRPCSLDQAFLLPPALQDWLPQDHLARFVAELVAELDLSAIYSSYERKDGRGQLGYHPLLLTRLLLFAYAKGVTSSRRIEQATYEDIAFRYLAANQHPDHDTIANFRRQHLEELAEIFVQVLRMCQKAGLVKLGNVAIDGTKILANASRKRNSTYDKLTESEQHWDQVIQQLLAKAQQTDEEEDTLLGKGQKESELPPELADAKKRLEAIRQAKRDLEREAQEQVTAAQGEADALKQERPDKNSSDEERSQHRQRKERSKKRVQRARANEEKPGRQHNSVDSDSRMMYDNGRKCTVQSYNAQAAVDSEAQVVVAAEVTQEVNDKRQLLPMVQSVYEQVGQLPSVVTADSGYWDATALTDDSLKGAEVLVAPDRHTGKKETGLAANAPRGKVAAEMRARLQSEEGQELYKVRKSTVEPVFGQIKETRGFRRFRLRGLTQVGAEWKLICLTHNLLKLYRAKIRSGSVGKAVLVRLIRSLWRHLGASAINLQPLEALP